MGENSKPIRPNEISVNLEKIIPDYVFEAVNDLLMENYRGTGSVNIKQDAIIAKILVNPNTTITRKELFDKHYMDFESVYRDYGWKVFYDKPAYDENYDAYFTFSAEK